MAKKINLADLVFKVSDDGSLKVFAGDAKKAGKALDKVEKSQEKTTYATKKGINQTANQTKNFANLARGISGSLVPAYATLAANVFALTAVFGFLQQAADFRVLREGQANFAHVTGVAYESLTNRIIDATDAQVRFTDAAQAAAIGKAGGLSSDQLVRLGEAAKLVSVALGRDVTDSFNRLIRGTTKAEPELLDELGIILRLDPATRKYATALGITKDSLTAFQRTQAVTNEVLDQVDSKFAAIAAISDPTTNSINKLQKAFDDLLNTFKLAIAGPAEALADFFSNNLRAAIGALGLFVLPLIQSMLPAFDNMAAEAEKSFERQRIAIDRTRQSMDSFKASQAAAMAKATASRQSSEKQLQILAQGQLGTGTSKAQIDLAAGRSISDRQLRSLKAQATKQIGIFKGMDAKIRANWIKTMNEMSVAHKATFVDKTILGFKKVETTAVIGFKRMQIAFSTAMKGMSRAASVAGRVISKAFAVFSAISIGLLVFEGVKAGAEKLGLFGEKAEEADKSTAGLIKRSQELNAEIDKMMAKDKQMADEGLSFTFDQIVKRNQERVAEAMGHQLGIGLIEDLRKGLNRPDSLLADARLGGPTNKQLLQDFQAVRIRSSVTGGMSTEILAQEKRAASEEEIAFFERLNKLAEAEEAFLERAKKLGETFPELAGIAERGATSVEQFTQAEKDFIANTVAAGEGMNTIERGAAKLDQTLQGIAPKARASSMALKDVTSQVNGLNAVLKVAGEAQQAAILRKVENDEELTDDEQSILNKMKRRDALTNIQGALTTKISKGDALTKQKNAAQSALDTQLKRIAAGTRLGKVAATNLSILTKQAEIEALIADIAFNKANLENAANEEDAKQKILEQGQQLAILKQQKQVLEDSIDPTMQLGKAFSEAFEKSLTSSIQGLLDGTKNLKDAFLDMTRAVLNAIAQILAQQAALAIMRTIMPGVGARDGGIMKKSGRSYSVGGVARGPQSGYPAILHGTEAVVPLPNGRSIPVEMQGGGGNVNNVVVNVDASGNASSTFNEEQGKALGMAIQASVMETLQREKRPGGILS